MKRRIAALLLSGAMLGMTISTGYGAQADAAKTKSAVEDSAYVDAEQTEKNETESKENTDSVEALTQEGAAGEEETVLPEETPAQEESARGEDPAAQDADPASGAEPSDEVTVQEPSAQESDTGTELLPEGILPGDEADGAGVLDPQYLITEEEVAGMQAVTLDAVPSYTYKYTYTLPHFGTINGVRYDDINLAAERVIMLNEGGYSTVVKNDAGALSIGKLQWHGDRAKELLRIIISNNNTLAYNTLGSTLYNEITSSKSWSKRVLTSTESTYIKNLITTTQGKTVQDALAKSDVYVYLNHGYSLGLRNAAAMVYFADLENQFGSGGCVKYTTYAKNIAGSMANVTLNELHLGTICCLIDKYSSPYQSYLIPRRRTTYGQVVAKGWTNYHSGDYVIPYDENGKAGLKWIQNALNVYQKAGLTVDGVSGTKTTQAIKAFQSSVGLTADGQAGTKTSSVLIYKLYGKLASTGSGGLVSVSPSAANKWVKSGTRWWYRHADGSYTTSGWEEIDGKWYYFDSSGWMVTGWQKVSGTWYYLDSSGAMVTGWQKVSGKWYYFDSTGAMVTGWQKVSGKWYYMDASGAMQTGWIEDGKVRYYLNASGAMQTGWLEENDSWYYFRSSGAMATGWAKVKGYWYYFNEDGIMQTGWVKVDSEYYYFDEDGRMAADTWIDNYYVDGNGVWTKTK